MEEWKDIEGYEGIYQVSDTGKVRVKRTGLIRSLVLGKTGYYKVSLKAGHSKTIDVHRLVATAFIPNPEGKKEVNHINGIKTDNRAENLEWVTRNENTAHAIKTGLWNPKEGKRIRIPVIAINESDGTAESFSSMKDASKKLGINPGSISHSVNDGWVVGGYRFFRKESI